MDSKRCARRPQKTAARAATATATTVSVINRQTLWLAAKSPKDPDTYLQRVRQKKMKTVASQFMNVYRNASESSKRNQMKLKWFKKAVIKTIKQLIN